MVRPQKSGSVPVGMNIARPRFQRPTPPRLCLTVNTSLTATGSSVTAPLLCATRLPRRRQAHTMLQLRCSMARERAVDNAAAEDQLVQARIGNLCRASSARPRGGCGCGAGGCGGAAGAPSNLGSRRSSPIANRLGSNRCSADSAAAASSGLDLRPSPPTVRCRRARRSAPASRLARAKCAARRGWCNPRRRANGGCRARDRRRRAGKHSAGRRRIFIGRISAEIRLSQKRSTCCGTSISSATSLMVRNASGDFSTRTPGNDGLIASRTQLAHRCSA